jgi:hypothetical protein
VHEIAEEDFGELGGRRDEDGEVLEEAKVPEIPRL